MDKMGQRDINVDIIKGIGILGMVMGHCNSPITHFIYLFHMAIFFIASGYCYKEKNSSDFQNVVSFIKRKFVTLWFPFVLWNAIYSILFNFFIRINVYTDNPLIFKYINGGFIVTTDYWSAIDILRSIMKGIFMLSGTQMGGAFWFLGTLMEISILYCVIDYILHIIFKKNNSRSMIAQLVISLLFLMAGFLAFKWKISLNVINIVFSYYILFYGGCLLKKYELSGRERSTSLHVIILLASFGILLIANKFVDIGLDTNSYGNPLCLLIVSFTGWQFLYEIAFWLRRLSVLKKLFVILGQNTLAVVILHFLCFKIVSYIGVVMYAQPHCLVAAFPILYYDGYWWIAYTMVGLSIPVILSLLWRKIKKSFFITKEISQ